MDHIDFDVRAGGFTPSWAKTAPAKHANEILYGLYSPNEGEILLNGQPVTIHSPSDAIALGIGMIHQHFMLVPSLTVAENVALGLPSSRKPLLDLDVVSEQIVKLSSAYGLQVEPDMPVWQLAVASGSASDPQGAVSRRGAADPGRADRRADASGSR